MQQCPEMMRFVRVPLIERLIARQEGGNVVFQCVVSDQGRTHTHTHTHTFFPHCVLQAARTQAKRLPRADSVSHTAFGASRPHRSASEVEPLLIRRARTPLSSRHCSRIVHERARTAFHHELFFVLFFLGSVDCGETWKCAHTHTHTVYCQSFLVGAAGGCGVTIILWLLITNELSALYHKG